MDDEIIQDLKQSIISAVHQEGQRIREDIGKDMSNLEKRLTKKIDTLETLTRSIAGTLTSAD